jgi:hypothetical protein
MILGFWYLCLVVLRWILAIWCKRRAKGKVMAKREEMKNSQMQNAEQEHDMR